MAETQANKLRARSRDALGPKVRAVWGGGLLRSAGQHSLSCPCPHSTAAMPEDAALLHHPKLLCLSVPKARCTPK